MSNNETKILLILDDAYWVEAWGDTIEEYEAELDAADEAGAIAARVVAGGEHDV